MKVSVVVAVWNTGPYLDDLIASLRAQTLPAAQWEAVLVDDGSTDGTAERLDRIAEETPNVRVIHAEHSGWPGRPRNIGIDAARGEYVFLADHDDRLAPDALERLTAFADAHGSDVVVGTMVGVGRSVPKQIFGRTVVDAQQRPDLLISSLTPQKLYRRALLDDRSIRFPEGVRRLEDHVFVVTAYLRAMRVSIYADAPIYYFVLRPDGQNASRRPVEWRGYFENAAEAIAVVDAEAPDEATRLVMRRRWLRIEALRRVRGTAFLRRGADRVDLVTAVRLLLERHYPQEEIDRLSVFERVAARLVQGGDVEGLAEFAAWEASVRVRPTVARAAFDRGTDELVLEIEAAQRGSRRPPSLLADPSRGFPSAGQLATMEHVPGDAKAVVTLRSAGRTVGARMEQQVRDGVLTASARVPLRGLADGAWTVRVRFSGLDRVPATPVSAAGLDPIRSRSPRARFAVTGRGAPVLQVGRRWTVARVVAGLRRRLG